MALINNSDEARLVRLAREFQETEQRKGLRWFPALGDQIPTDDDVKRELAVRQAALEGAEAAAREQERNQPVPTFGRHAVVPADAHPAFGMPPAEVEAQQPRLFGAEAAETVEQKKQLHRTFTAGLWTMLARMRAERRLQRMANAQRMRAAAATAEKEAAAKGTERAASLARKATASPVSDASARGSESNRSVYNLNVRNIALLTLPALPPAASDPMQSAAGGGGSAGSLAAALAAERPTPADAEVFTEKELKQPFEFKLRHYTRFKFTDHHFATCDPVAVPPNFPAGPAEAAEADADVPVPSVPSFSQPQVTLETFPGFEFPFQRTLPHEGLVKGSAPQPVSTGGFKDPLYHLDYGHAAPSLALPRDAVRQAVVSGALPAPMRASDPADDVSDDDDEDADLDLPKPASLLSIAANFLPPMTAAAAPPTPSADGERRKSTTGVAVGVGVGDAAGENMLAPEPRPINNTGRELVNRPVAEAFAAHAAQLNALAEHLPPTDRIRF